jgi:hypothetical protein
LQQHYWNELYQLRTHIYFLDLKVQQAEFIDRLIKMLLAITSSASIGGWVIWNEYALVWAGIVAIANVINAVLPYLPYKNRIKTYSNLVNDLEQLIVTAEYKWYAISSGQMCEEDINHEIYKIKTDKNKFLQKHVLTSIVEDTKRFAKAEKMASDYMETNLG